MLFTAQAYVDKLASAECDTQQAVDRLAPLVRCPHLSQFWLSVSMLSDDTDKQLLRGLQPQLKRLMLLKPACSTELGRRVADIPGVPASWLLPLRDIQPGNNSRVSMAWGVDVATIRQAAQNSANQQTAFSLESTFSTVVGGFRWGLQLECKWDDNKQGSTIGLYAKCMNVPAGSFCGCTILLQYAVVIHMQETCYIDDSNRRGWSDFFGLGAMAGVFDEAAWAAKKLPATGSQLCLYVSDVGM